ncbi:hypothetical protein L1887_54421 [Cichorium endivia]|nr:hypothetical protein L1887_54421 [Cichorium endivia]
MVLPYSSLLAVSVSDGAVCTVDGGAAILIHARDPATGVSRHDVVTHTTADLRVYASPFDPPERWRIQVTVAPQFWRRFLQRSSKPSQHNRTSLFRYLFPNVHAEARRKLDNLRYHRLPHLRHKAQASIYRYLVSRQLRKKQRKFTGILGRLRVPRVNRRSIRSPKDATALRHKENMAFNSSGGSGYADLSVFRSEGKEPGARRKKLAGYLKAANELRSSYWQGGDSNASKGGDEGQDNPFPDASIVKNGNAEMILFPSYARKHVKNRERPVSDENSNDEDYWRRQWGTTRERQSYR